MDWVLEAGAGLVLVPEEGRGFALEGCAQNVGDCPAACEDGDDPGDAPEGGALEDCHVEDDEGEFDEEEGWGLEFLDDPDHEEEFFETFFPEDRDWDALVG